MKIKLYENGPALISSINEIELEYESGLVEIENKKSIAICRCGKSKNSPFCDGSHAK